MEGENSKRQQQKKRAFLFRKMFRVRLPKERFETNQNSWGTSKRSKGVYRGENDNKFIQRGKKENDCSAEKTLEQAVVCFLWVWDSVVLDNIY